jgi:hypothetical protein
MRNTIYQSFARRKANDNSIIFEEDLDSEGELAVHSGVLKADLDEDFELDEDNFGI